MRCLYSGCKKDATGSIELRECADGHRTGQLTKEQVAEIIGRVGRRADDKEAAPRRVTRKAA